MKESPLELSAFVLGGIGIFLIGIHFAGDHLKKLSGGKFQRLITRLSGNKAGIATSGATLGFITQSGKAAAFILSDFVQAGMMKVRQAAPIVFWANAGCSLIVFASMVSLKVLALFVLGITALGLTFHVPKRAREWLRRPVRARHDHVRPLSRESRRCRVRAPPNGLGRSCRAFTTIT